MRQYRITTENVLLDDPTDCYIEHDEQFEKFKRAHLLGGLGSEQVLAEYRASQLPKIDVKTADEVAYGKSLKPGTDEWFRFHFRKVQK